MSDAELAQARVYIQTNAKCLMQSVQATTALIERLRNVGREPNRQEVKALLQSFSKSEKILNEVVTWWGNQYPGQPLPVQLDEYKREVELLKMEIDMRGYRA